MGLETDVEGLAAANAPADSKRHHPSTKGCHVDLKERLHAHVFGEDSLDLLSSYLNEGKFSGAWFDRLGGKGDAPEVADQFTTADLVAVSTLSVRISGWAAVQLLDTRADALADLLHAIPRRVALHEATDEDLAAVFAAQQAIDELDGVGHVTRSKLLARKRPHLVPIRDQFVLIALVGHDHGNFTRPLRDVLTKEHDVLPRLDELRHAAGHPDLSLLRTLDIVVWMRTHGSSTVGPN